LVASPVPGMRLLRAARVAEHQRAGGGMDGGEIEARERGMPAVEARGEQHDGGIGKAEELPGKVDDGARRPVDAEMPRKEPERALRRLIHEPEKVAAALQV